MENRCQSKDVNTKSYFEMSPCAHAHP